MPKFKIGDKVKPTDEGHKRLKKLAEDWPTTMGPEVKKALEMDYWTIKSVDENTFGARRLNSYQIEECLHIGCFEFELEEVMTKANEMIQSIIYNYEHEEVDTLTEEQLEFLAEKHCPKCGGTGLIDFYDSVPYGSTNVLMPGQDICPCATARYDRILEAEGIGGL